MMLPECGASRLHSSRPPKRRRRTSCRQVLPHRKFTLSTPCRRARVAYVGPRSPHHAHATGTQAFLSKFDDTLEAHSAELTRLNSTIRNVEHQITDGLDYKVNSIDEKCELIKKQMDRNSTRWRPHLSLFRSAPRQCHRANAITSAELRVCRLGLLIELWCACLRRGRLQARLGAAASR